MKGKIDNVTLFAIFFSDGIHRHLDEVLNCLLIKILNTKLFLAIFSPSNIFFNQQLALFPHTNVLLCFVVSSVLNQYNCSYCNYQTT